MIRAKYHLDLADGVYAAALGVGLLQGRWVFICALLGLGWLRAREKRRAWQLTQVTCAECQVRQ